MNIESNFLSSQSFDRWTSDKQKKDNNSESNQLQIEVIDKDQREEIHKISYKPKSNYTHGQDKRGNLCDEEHLKGLDNPLVSIIQEQAKSVACMIFSEQLKELYSGGYQLLDKTTLAKRMEKIFNISFGEKEVFRDEPAPGFGTAFFIGGKFALTAGHCVCLSQRNKKYSCVKNQECLSEDIANTKLVFHFKMEEKNRSKEIFAKGDVYEIEKVVCHAFTKIKDKDQCESEWEDWAIIELKEEVKGREPLSVNCFKKVAKKINLYMLGHPSGLPVKLTKDGCVKNDAHPKYFTCDLDAFSGNSGSPVFNREKPHEVVGILCGGGEDYEVTNNYKGTGQKRVQTHHVTVGFEKCQRVSSLLIELERCGIFKVRPPPEETKINQFLNSLKNSYTRNKEIPQLIYKKEKILELIHERKEIPSEPTLPIDAIYTQLVLIEKSDNEKKEPEINGLAEINGWESIQGSKKAIALDRLFEKSEDQKEAPKTLLILGKAGVGKSTLCHHIARQWAKGNLWNDKFDALFWVPLRQLQNSDSNETATSFLFRHCCQGTHELYPSEIANYIKNNNDKILFVLDGYDEIDQKHKKIVDELQENSHWMITSRPYAAQNLKADAMIENVGFTSETIEIYIHQLFLNNKEKAEIALQAIRQNSLIFNLCHIPINLELISTIIENQIEENNRKKSEVKNTATLSSIQSMSDLYQTLTLTLQKRFLKKIGKINSLWTGKQGEMDRISEEEDIDQLDEILDSKEISPIFEFLESAAFIALKNKELLFSFNKGSLKKLYQQYSTEEKEAFRKNIPLTRFIHCSSSAFYSGQHSFIHLTFQEFFAARHLVRLLQSQERRVEAEQAIKEIKFNPRYKVVIWFIAGLLKNDPKNLNAFFDLLDEPKDAIGLYSAMLKVRCLEECGWSDQVKKIHEYEEEIRWWCNQMTRRRLWEQVRKFVTEAFEISPLGAKRVLSPILVSLLENHWRKYLRVRPINLFADPEVILPSLIKFISFKTSRYSIGNIFIKTLLQIDIQCLLPLLKNLLRHENFWVRHYTINAIVIIGQKNLNWISPLIKEASEDVSSELRYLAVYALTALGLYNEKPPMYLFQQAFPDNECFIFKERAYVSDFKEKQKWTIPLIEQTLSRKWNDYINDYRSEDLSKKLYIDEKMAAVKAVGKLAQGNQKWAFPLIEQAFNDDKGVRLAAVKTVGKLAQSNLKWDFILFEKALKEEDKAERLDYKGKVRRDLRVFSDLLSKIDWSLSAERLHHLFLYLFKWEAKKPRLSSTPLSSLIKNYNNVSLDQSNYSLAISIKCIEQNIAIFLKNNTTICFYEKGEMHQIENIPDAAQRIIHIQQTIKELPSKYKNPKKQN